MHQDEGVGVPGPPDPCPVLPTPQLCLHLRGPVCTPGHSCLHIQAAVTASTLHSCPQWPLATQDLGVHTPVGRAALHGGREGAYGALRVGSGPLGRELGWGVLPCKGQSGGHNWDSAPLA